MTKKRVVFLIEKEYLHSLRTLSQKKGVSISHILRNLIYSQKHQQLESSGVLLQSTAVPFNFYLDNNELRKLSKQAYTQDMVVSAYLRSIIRNYFEQSTEGINTNNLETLFREGEIKLLVDYFDGEKKLSFSEQILNVKVNIEIGNLDKSLKAISHTRSRNDKARMHPYFSLAESEILAIQNKYDKANDILDRVSSQLTTQNNRYLFGYFYFIKSYINSQNKNISDGLQNIQKSIEYYDIVNHPIELARSYLYMTDFLEFEKKYEEADKYYKRSEEITESMNNHYFKGFLLGGKSYNQYMKNNMRKSAHHAKLAINQVKKSGSHKQLSYSYSNLGKALLFQQKYEKAYDCLSQAVKLESTYKKTSVSSANLLKTYIEIINNSKIAKLEYVLNSTKTIKPTHKYLLFAAHYLHGRSQKEVKDGKNNLTMLANENVYNHLESAIKQTINKRRLHPTAF